MEPHPTQNDPYGLALARPLFGADIVVMASDPMGDQYQALPQELASFPNAADKRNRAFAAGRAAAHQAMQSLNVAVQPILFGPDRAPIWPKTVVGSISHCETSCLAAVARSNAYLSIGIDVEENTPLDADLIPTICTPAERAWLSMHSATQAGLLAKLIFSAKECAYKCQYPFSKTVFDFDVFELTPDMDTGQFDATFAQDIGPFTAGTMLSGRFAISDTLIVTAMSVKE